MLWLSKWALNQVRVLISWNSVINFFRSYFGTVSAFFFTLYQRKCKQIMYGITRNQNITKKKKKRLPNYVKHCSRWFLARSKEKVTVRVLGEQGMSTSHSCMCFVGGTCVFFWEITVELHSVQFWHGIDCVTNSHALKGMNTAVTRCSHEESLNFKPHGIGRQFHSR